VHANPDGNGPGGRSLHARQEPKNRALTGLPRLYQKYIGHDNNRDFYANTQAETKNMNRVMYREWLRRSLQSPPGRRRARAVLSAVPRSRSITLRPAGVSGHRCWGGHDASASWAENKPAPRSATARSTDVVQRACVPLPTSRGSCSWSRPACWRRNRDCCRGRCTSGTAAASRSARDSWGSCRGM